MSESIIKNYDKKFEECNLYANVDEIKTAQIVQIKQLTENNLLENNLIKTDSINSLYVKRAYCPECGKELTTKFPSMFNPFTQEKQCIHECTTCGIKYNLDYAYPRIAFMDENNNEIFVHCE